MNFIEQLRQLDIREPGRWPTAFRLMAIGAVFLVLAALMVWQFVVRGNMPDLDAARAEQDALWQTFDAKQRKAANLDAYRQQLVEIERNFGAMLRQLPGKTEVPSLLVDISQTGLAAGLREKLFEPSGEIRKDFYAELPIKIQLTGGYHEFGNFVSGIASLPRIVTLHDIEIARASRGRGGELTLDLTAKTYRYLEESEVAAPDGAARAQ